MLFRSVESLFNEASCQQFYDLVLSFYEKDTGSCFDHSDGLRGEIREEETGVVARCLFRFHCITRLVGITDDAIQNSPPPLFNLTLVDAAIKKKIESAYCDGSGTLNQLFQNSDRCEQIKPIVTNFCKIGPCFQAGATTPQWCDTSSTCNAMLDNYARFCVPKAVSDKNLTQWADEFERAWPPVESCNVTYDKLIPSYADIGTIISTDGSKPILSNTTAYLPEARSRGGRRCNAGSRDCGCLIHELPTARIGAGGICAKHLTCIDGICKKLPYTPKN